ncbi:MAG TPA: S1 RNA-binding domain-containing protein, partial [Candidatus Sulfotelmatobacter sp.]|nr:S1 RNA-binding domain-containing protein [Candidatus Sulfotelmatobacter sp.]
MTAEPQGGPELTDEAQASPDTSPAETVATAIADEPAETSTADTTTPPTPAAAAQAAAPEAAPAPDAAEPAVAPVPVPPASQAEVAEEPIVPGVPAAGPEGVPAAGPETASVAAEAEAAEAEAAPPAVPVAPPPPAPVVTPAAPRFAGPEPTTMEELLASSPEEIRSLKHGDVVEGSVVRIDKDEILVDIGAKSEGVVSNRELYGRHAEAQPVLAVGDIVLVYVLQPESEAGHAVLSLRRAGLERKWRSMQEQFEAGVIIEAPVIDHNKGGLIVDCGIRGFVPISQIVDFPRRPQNDQPRDAAQEIAEKLQPFVGRRLR